MRRRAPAPWCFVLLWLEAAIAGAQTVTLEQWREGDRAVLDRVLAETRAQTQEPAPAWSDYLYVLAEVVQHWLADRMRPLGALFGLAPGVLTGVAWLVLGAVAVVLVLLGVHLFMSWRRSSRARHAATFEGRTATAAPAAPSGAWALELEQRLNGTDPRRALEALWWWLAGELTGSAALPSWTTRELLQEARRPDLRREGHLLDRLLYAGREPAMADVRGLAARLREVVA